MSVGLQNPSSQFSYPCVEEGWAARVVEVDQGASAWIQSKRVHHVTCASKLGHIADFLHAFCTRSRYIMCPPNQPVDACVSYRILAALV